MDFIHLCKLSELPPEKRGKHFILNDDFDIAVFVVNEKIYAVENTCPHNQSHVMYDGIVDEALYLMCPVHGWKFHLVTGETPPEMQLGSKLKIYRTKIEGADVYIEKPKKKFFSW